MGCIERLPFEVEDIELRRQYVSSHIMRLSRLEQQSNEIHELSVVDFIKDRIKKQIRSAHRLGWIAMSELNDTTILYGLDEKQILELLG